LLFLIHNQAPASGFFNRDDEQQ